MRLIACGDIVLGGRIETSIRAEEAKEILAPIRDMFMGADIALGNIECPVTDETKPGFEVPPVLKAGKETARILTLLGITVASLANNHIADYGQKGLRDTIEVLEKENILWLGAGWTEEEASKPLVVDTNDMCVGILALAQRERSAADIKGWGAGVLDEKRAIEAVAELRKRVDAVICYFHFGIEFAEYPTPNQVDLCHGLIDAGASLVIGHHPHVPQGYEAYKDGFIAYSLGNFIFDMASGPHKFSRLGLVVDVEVTRSGIDDLKLLPFDTNTGFPTLLEGRERKEAEDYLNRLMQTISDRNEIKRKYYFICRENLYTSLDAFLRYGLLKKSLRRMKSCFEGQFWPHIFQLRKDLIRFIVKGDAIRYEKLKSKGRSKSVVLYETVCRVVYFLFFGWISRKHQGLIESLRKAR